MERRCLLHCSFQMRCWARDPAKGGAWMSEAVLRPDRATPYRHSADEVLRALGTDAQSGLSRAEARARLERFGRNLLARSEEHTSELQSLMRISYAVFCLKKKQNDT